VTNSLEKQHFDCKVVFQNSAGSKVRLFRGSWSGELTISFLLLAPSSIAAIYKMLAEMDLLSRLAGAAAAATLNGTMRRA
jgi:hypothetical protein